MKVLTSGFRKLLDLLSSLSSLHSIPPTAVSVVFCCLVVIGLTNHFSLKIPQCLHRWLLTASDSQHERRVLFVKLLVGVWTLGTIGLGLGLVKFYVEFGLPMPSDSNFWLFVLLIATLCILWPLGLSTECSELVKLSYAYPLLCAIKNVDWCSTWEEWRYRSRLMEHLDTSLGVRQKCEYGVYGGTRVDLWIRFRNVEWYVRFKKGLDNQKRLNLQGEAEDILAHSGKKEIGIIDVIGITLEKPAPAEQKTHIANLKERMRARGPDNYHVVPVPLRREPP